MKAIKVLSAFIFLVFIFKVDASAVSLSISGTPSTIDQSQEFQLNITLSCSGCSDSYIRGVFYPSGTSYFGYTQDNGSNWINASGSNCTNYFKIAQSDLVGGSWSGVLRFKPDKDSTYYNGPGEYFFKVGRYTASCSTTWSEEKIIAITGPTPTPTQAPTNTPTNTPTPTQSPTNTPTPTKKPSITPTKIPSKTPTGSLTPSTSSASVLGQNMVEPLQEPETEVKGVSVFSGEKIIPIILIALGILFLILCAGIISYPYIKKFKDERFKNG